LKVSSNPYALNARGRPSIIGIMERSDAEHVDTTGSPTGRRRRSSEDLVWFS